MLCVVAIVGLSVDAPLTWLCVEPTNATSTHVTCTIHCIFVGPLRLACPGEWAIPATKHGVWQSYMNGRAGTRCEEWHAGANGAEGAARTPLGLVSDAFDAKCCVCRLFLLVSESHGPGCYKEESMGSRSFFFSRFRRPQLLLVPSIT